MHIHDTGTLALDRVLHITTSRGNHHSSLWALPSLSSLAVRQSPNVSRRLCRYDAHRESYGSCCRCPSPIH